MAQLDERVARLEANQEKMVMALELVVETQREMVARMDTIVATQQAMLEVQREHTTLLGQIVETLGAVVETQGRILSKLMEHDAEFSLMRGYLRREET